MIMISKTNTRGFTLIELLVVIAIIGILASVVLASLNSARDKGSDAALKGALAQFRAQAELYYDGVGNRTYTGLCAHASVSAIRANALANAYQNNATVCNDASGAYAIQGDLKSAGGSGSRYWCVDSTGKAGPATASALGTATACP
jgi:prepilin-type N-terminal cleavage/methylation domain-containing protein